MLTGDNGIIKNAGSAKEQAEIEKEKEVIGTASIQAINKNKFGEITQKNLQDEIDDLIGENKALVTDENDSYLVKYLDTERYYEVNKNGNVEYLPVTNGSEKILTIQCVNSVGTVLLEKKYTILRDTYSKKPPTINDYEIAQQGYIEGEITENKTIQVLYYLILNDDTELVFTGLNVSGNITTDENEIVSYMIGDGSNSRPNGFVNSSNKDIKTILNIPKQYKGKPVTRIGAGAFGSNGSVNIVKINFTENITRIDAHAFLCCRTLEELTLEKNIESIGHEAFLSCINLKKVVFKNGMQSYALCFGRCDLWTELETNTNNTNYSVEDNILYSKDKKKIIKYPTGRTDDLIIKESVVEIAYAAFYNAQIKSVELNNVTIVGKSAFQYSSIQDVKIGTDVETIGKLGFFGCKNLKTVTIDSASIARIITGIGRNNGGNAPAGCLIDYAETIYIRNDITDIGSYILENYSPTTSDKEGYIKYVINT